MLEWLYETKCKKDKSIEPVLDRDIFQDLQRKSHQAKPVFMWVLYPTRKGIWNVDFSGGSKPENPEKNSVGNPRSNTTTDNKLSPHTARGWNRTWATSMCKRNLTLMTSAKFRLLLGVEDTGYVKIEQRLTNILFLLISTFFCPFDSHCFTLF